MISKSKHILILFLVFFLLQTATSQIEIKTSRDSILIGEELELFITYPIDNATTSLDFFEGDSIGNGFEVLGVFPKDTTKGKVSYTMTITNFEEGTRFIPAFSIFYGEDKLASKPIPIDISLVEVDTTQPFRDIKPIIQDPLTSSDYLSMALNWLKTYWWIVLSVLLIIVALIWFLFRKNEVVEVKSISKPNIPAHVLAMNSLKKLEEKQLWQNGKQKQYNVELTAIIQQYISNRYKVTTAEKTSSEILHSLRFIEIGKQNKQNLKKLLTLSDLVKFAKEKPTPEDNDSVLKEAYQFINTTQNQISE